jgi:BlaI family penicillinase repressor
MAGGTVRLSRFELELMDVLWAAGRASIRELQERLPEGRRPAYTTVQTIVNRLEEKGAVRRLRKIGNAHIYEAVAHKRAVRRRLVDDFLGLFGGSAQHLLAHLLDEGRLSLEDVRELERSHAESQAHAGLQGRSEALGRKRRAPRRRRG